MQKVILIVEDVDILRTFAVVTLQSAGYVVAAAEHALAALAMLRAAHFDLVLMDIQMPFISGIEAVARIRSDADKLTARTPVVAFTSDQIDAPAKFCREHGFDGYLKKNADGAQLIGFVERFLAGQHRP